MKIILFFGFGIWFFWVVFNSLFLPEIIKKKIEKGDLLSAYELSKYSRDLNLFNDLMDFIRNDYRDLKKIKVSRLSGKEFVKLVEYMDILRKPSSDFYPLIVEAKRRKSPVLLKKIKDNHTSEAWRDKLQEYFDKDKNAG